MRANGYVRYAELGPVLQMMHRYDAGDSGEAVR
jgi:hypothetical protein